MPNDDKAADIARKRAEVEEYDRQQAEARREAADEQFKPVRELVGSKAFTHMRDKLAEAAQQHTGDRQLFGMIDSIVNAMDHLPRAIEQAHSIATVPTPPASSGGPATAA